MVLKLLTMAKPSTVFTMAKPSIILTMAKPSIVRVNSGPRETMSLRITERTSVLMATGVGMVITIAADTSNRTQIRPEMGAPESKWKFVKGYLEQSSIKK